MWDLGVGPATCEGARVMHCSRYVTLLLVDNVASGCMSLRMTLRRHVCWC